MFTEKCISKCWHFALLTLDCFDDRHKTWRWLLFHFVQREDRKDMINIRIHFFVIELKLFRISVQCKNFCDRFICFLYNPKEHNSESHWNEVHKPKSDSRNGKPCLFSLLLFQYLFITVSEVFWAWTSLMLHFSEDWKFDKMAIRYTKTNKRTPRRSSASYVTKQRFIALNQQSKGNFNVAQLTSHVQQGT